MGHIIHIDRLKFAARPHQRHERRQPCHGGKAVKKLIFRPEHNRRPQDHRLWESRLNACFTLRFGLRVKAIAVRIRTDSGHMDKPRSALLFRNPRNACSPFGLNGIKLVFP